MESPKLKCKMNALFTSWNLRGKQPGKMVQTLDLMYYRFWGKQKRFRLEKKANMFTIQKRKKTKRQTIITTRRLRCE
jgi:hypothetical protein